ncbi:MAG: aminotransferase class V-fold PLP-dependent enzyme [Myxococcales bacterium]|nr:aminotransferase class V-fold PLP-dependent enzyme [Myxococcales bacterium]
MATEGALQAELGSRAGFPELQSRAYLAHAAISPPSVWVVDRVRTYVDTMAAGGVTAFPQWIDQREVLRGKLASLVGAKPQEIALMPNTTRGVSDIALSVPWEPGDRVLVLRGEFPTNVTPWQRAAKLFGLELRWLDADSFRTEEDRALQALATELERGVRLLAVSAVQFQTGHRMPLERIGELCQRYGCELFVDAIQACGATPIDVASCSIDYLSCGSHKWLMGTDGCGFLYVREAKCKGLEVHTAGWLSHEDGLRFLFEGAGHLSYERPLKQTAAVFETGMTNGAGFAALEASLDLIQGLGVRSIYTHVQAYLDQLEPAVAALGFESLRAAEASGRSCTLSFRSDQHDVVKVHEVLNERGIHCSAPDGCLRFAPHWPNNLDEVSHVVTTLRDVVALV